MGTGRLVAAGTVGITIADGSREQDPPAGADAPTVIAWRVGSQDLPGAILTIENAVAGQRVAMLVRPVPDTITQFDVAVVRGQEVPSHAG